MPRLGVLLTFWKVAAFTLPLLSIVSAGPDPNPLSFCPASLNSLSREDRKALRSSTQTVQALSSHVAQARLSALTNQTQLQQLELWLASNTSESSKLSGTGLGPACLGHRRQPFLYHGRPVFSILLEYFKRPWAISRMASTLQSACQGANLPCELVVNVDNPHEAADWAAVAAASGGFVVPVFSSNVHEARGYNRAAKAARGQYLIIWQDDQIAPASSSWLHHLLLMFRAWPQLAIVGMNTYRLCKHAEPTNRFGPTPWAPDPRTGVAWSFVQNVDFAPLVVRASAWLELGGLEESFTRSGDCGIWGDWELCTRAWLDGWQVGYLHLEGRSGDGHEGGTHTATNAERCWGRQQYVAASGFDKRYGVGKLQNELCEKVWRLNVESFRLTDPAMCPYGVRETNFGNCTRPQV